MTFTGGYSDFVNCVEQCHGKSSTLLSTPANVSLIHGERKTGTGRGDKLLLNFMTNVTKIVDFDTLSFLLPDEKFQRDTTLGKLTFARSAEEWG